MPPNIFIENVPTRKESHENLYLLLLYLMNTYFKIKKNLTGLVFSFPLKNLIHLYSTSRPIKTNSKSRQQQHQQPVISWSHDSAPKILLLPE